MDTSDADPQDVRQTLTEGKAEIIVKATNVFYNPVQEFNRDLSIAVLNVFSGEHYTDSLRKHEKAHIKNKTLTGDTEINDVHVSIIDDKGLSVGSSQKGGLRILEALSATGLRSIRYAKEIQGVESILANDISEIAVESIKLNIKHNLVEDLVQTSHEDASMVMYKNKHHSNRFTAVDLDPYGCPSIFLDGAVQCVADSGLLLVTATDMAVLAGNAPETCYSKYGAISLRSKNCHEMALRILLQCIESHANRYGRYITPLLSVSVDFYIRVFVKINTSPLICKKSTSKLSMVYQCVGCDCWTLQPLGAFKPNPSEKNPNQTKAYLPHVPPVGTNCKYCNQRHHVGGPIWSDRIHDRDFVRRVLQHVQNEPQRYKTVRRIEGVLSVINEEVPDAPLYYTIDYLCKRLHITPMPMITMRSAIINAGFDVSYSHASKQSIKTNAPANVLWDIMREWEKSHPIKKQTLEADPTTRFILDQPMSINVNLTKRLDANPNSRKSGFLRFQTNPEPNWGPGFRASTNTNDEKDAKSKRNQNKKSRKKNENLSVKREISPKEKDEAPKHIKLSDVNSIINTKRIE